MSRPRFANLSRRQILAVVHAEQAQAAARQRARDRAADGTESHQEIQRNTKSGDRT